MTIRKGDSISFRLSQSTPSEIINLLAEKKETEGRNFSSFLLSVMINGLKQEMYNKNEIRIQIPNTLSIEQKKWINNAENISMIITLLSHREKNLNNDLIQSLEQVPDKNNNMNPSTKQFILQNFLY
ncbi:hypothetical protein [Gottfriedia acidiceleris]|uniref:Uncharacterized protein n=1 Tax=Gottfriedia acidiceleris TaxID=371036 RepID=A0ABY4JF11_9BACI|nr:hypothetical protein [Gottfriedia acidiceleris]UPM52437.1 hypothetical protein MY490_11330 [Gottfriedia acidiceleris]